MARRLFWIFCAASLVVANSGCKSEKTPKEILAEKQTAFKITQKQQAIKAYQQIVTKYPDSEYAAKARERLRALQPAGAATTKK